MFKREPLKDHNVIDEEKAYSLVPKRRRQSSKRDYGRLLAVCGSTYYRGAAALCCKAALRMGVGIMTLASTEKVICSVTPTVPECTFLPMIESENGTVSAKNVDRILDMSKKCSSVLIGCGLSLDGDTRELVKAIVTGADCRLIVDADGLNVLSECPNVLKEAREMPVITPHFAEMARLTGKRYEDIANDPEKAAVDFAKEYRCCVVLKSHVTYIAHSDGRVAINSETGNAGLARGGSGDVLAGMIASLCAQGLEPFDAAVCGVYLHGEAADRCADRLSETGMLPSDILTDLCEIFTEI